MLKRFSSAGLALVLMLALSGDADAQKVENPWSLEGYVGMVLPTGNWAQITQASAGVGAMVGYQLHQDWVVLANLNYASMKSSTDFANTINTDWDLFGAFAMVGYEIDAGDVSKVLIPVGLGVMSFDPKQKDQGDITLESTTAFALNGGLKFTTTSLPRSPSP
jgi:hypothetical protein